MNKLWGYACCCFTPKLQYFNYIMAMIWCMRWEGESPIVIVLQSVRYLCPYLCNDRASVWYELAVETSKRVVVRAEQGLQSLLHVIMVLSLSIYMLVEWVSNIYIIYSLFIICCCMWNCQSTHEGKEGSAIHMDTLAFVVYGEANRKLKVCFI